MPIVAHNELPTFERLHQEGQTILTPDRAGRQTIRELHIGVLNMMPDAALAATERQFSAWLARAIQSPSSICTRLRCRSCRAAMRRVRTSIATTIPSSRFVRRAWMLS